MQILIDAAVDTAKLIPLLAAIYLIVSLLEYRYADRMNHCIMHLGSWGPVAGALFGCIPQCGFSVIASALYVKRLISMGTLLAVFISTSDEAVPVLLAMPDRASMVGSLILIKLAIAVLAGLGVDFAAGKLRPAADAACPGCASYGDAVKDHAGCCSHGLAAGKTAMRTLIIHPLLHTAKIAAFLFAFMSLAGALVAAVGAGRLTSLLLSGTVLQPALASLIGLIPNCFASVFLAQLFAEGAISFGSLVAGLSSGAGLGLLVLARENPDRRDTVCVIAVLLSVSISSGVIIQLCGRFL